MVKMKSKLTDRFLQSIKAAPTGKRITYWDTSVDGFAIRVSDKSSPSNVGSFMLIRRMPKNPNPTARKIGSYPAMTLAAARTTAKEWNTEIDEGVDPAVKAAEEAREQKRQDADTFESVFETYAKERLGRLRTGAQIQRAIAHYVLPVLGSRPISDIRRADVKALVVHIHQTAPIASNRVLSYLKTFFVWCVEEEHLEVSPTAVMRPLANEVKRDRVLDDDEIKAVWLACGALGAFGHVVRLMLVTGQRRGEVGGMLWAEIDRSKRLWTLPKERTKAARAHEVPLSDLAMSVIDECPEMNKFVFPHARGSAAPVSGWSRAKAALDRKSGVADWHLHDLRHTCATNLARLRVDRIVISKILNHAEGGVTSRYDRHDRADLKRAALNRWGAKLVAIIEGGEDNVISIRR
jgi:integrase